MQTETARRAAHAGTSSNYPAAATAAQEILDVQRELVDRPLARLERGPRDVRRDDKIGNAGIEQRAAFRRRFFGQYVDGRAAEVSAAQCRDQCIEIDQRAAC